MSDDKPVIAEIKTHFGADSLPAVYERMSSFDGYLTTSWRRYQAVMQSGEIEPATKDLMGFSVAIAKSNDYVIALQRQRMRGIGIGLDKELEALAVTDFK